MHIPLIDLLDRVDPAVENRVKKVLDNARAAIREAMRSECRLSLRGGDANDHVANAQVPITIQPGLPEAVYLVKFPENFDLVIKLMPFRSALVKAAANMEDLQLTNQLLMSHPLWAGLAFAGEAQLPAIKNWAIQLLALLDKHDPAKLILAVNEDVLGAYFYDPRETDPLASNWARIELYWGVIGLISNCIDCSVEDLTVVVMTHELAHAYTQLGADIDGCRWASQNFSHADVGLKEGLAQYFTARVLDRLTKRFPGAKSAYQTLLDKQPEIYRLHLPWIKEGISPEAVRRAMLEIRRSGEKTLAEFHDRLHKAHIDFSTHREQ